ncbi:MAG: response regulator transcription factor [Nitrospirae bacterium]|nr:response regulator transcription factor [Nitrospirota bacterium]
MIWLNVSSLPVPSKKKGRFLAAHLFRDITKQAKVRQLVDELHTALSCVASPGPDPHADQPPEIPTALPLSEREREVLRLLALGKNTKSIADALCISPATVRNHIQHILEKLGAHNRLQALATAFHPGVHSS